MSPFFDVWTEQSGHAGSQVLRGKWPVYFRGKKIECEIEALLGLLQPNLTNEGALRFRDGLQGKLFVEEKNWVANQCDPNLFMSGVFVLCGPAGKTWYCMGTGYSRHIGKTREVTDVIQFRDENSSLQVPGELGINVEEVASWESLIYSGEADWDHLLVYSDWLEERDWVERAKDMRYMEKIKKLRKPGHLAMVKKIPCPKCMYPGSGFFMKPSPSVICPECKGTGEVVVEEKPGT